MLVSSTKTVSLIFIRITIRTSSFRAKLNAKLSNRLTYSVNFNFNKTAYKYAGYYNEQQTIHSLQSNILSRFVPRNPDGTIVQYTNQLTSNSPLGAGHAGFLTANEARNSRENKYWISGQPT